MSEYSDTATVVGRVYVSELTRRAYSKDAVHVQMQAVSRGPENKVWAAYTPSASFTMTIAKGLAGEVFAEWFDEEADIEVTFRKVPRAED